MTERFVQALACSILVHELLYVFRDGAIYLSRCFLPTFGLQLGPRGHAAAHVLLVVGCLGLLRFPGSVLVLSFALAAFVLVVASYSLRLSNHLMLVGFMFVVVCAGRMLLDRPDVFISVGVRGLLAMTYFFAFFHKCNAEYLSPAHSAATQLVEFHCDDRGVSDVRLRKWLGGMAIHGTLAIEALLAGLVLFASGSTLVWTLMLGLGFHFILALAGILNFSSVMYAGLLALVPDAAWERGVEGILGAPPAVLGFAVAIPVVLVVLVTPRDAGPRCPYVLRTPAWVLQIAFGAWTGLAMLGLTALLDAPPGPAPSWSSLPGQWVLLTVWGLFAFNGIGPYLGLKTEFSFSMFSNLRHEPWTHLFFPGEWRPFDCSDYVRIVEVRGLRSRDEGGDSDVDLILHVLAHHREFACSRRFLLEGVRRLSRGPMEDARLEVDYLDRDGTLRTASAAAAEKAGSITLFPFLMPLDPERPHSEQGSVLATSSQGRRLF